MTNQTAVVRPGRYSDGGRCWDVFVGRDLYLAYDRKEEADSEAARLNSEGDRVVCEVAGCGRFAEVTRNGYVMEMCAQHNRECAK